MRFGAMAVTKPYDLICVGAMDVTKPYEFIVFGAMAVTKPYEFIGHGTMDVTKPYESIMFGAMAVTKPYEFIAFGAMEVTKPYEFYRVWEIRIKHFPPGPEQRRFWVSKRPLQSPPEKLGGFAPHLFRCLVGGTGGSRLSFSLGDSCSLGRFRRGS